METKTTCQICEREIKSKSGLVAHHGYTRPDRGSGWQTESCHGARHLPYEISCDIIQPTINVIKVFVASQEARLVEMVKNPPATMTRIKAYQEPKVYPRPEGFDAEKCLKESGFSFSQQYELEFNSQHYHIREAIRMGKYDTNRLEKRLANWVAPK